jgi:hypothetical protein
MKTKILTTLASAACCLLMMFLHTQASAQQATKARVQADGARDARHPAMLVETTNAQRLPNGNVVINDMGAVQVTTTEANGSVTTAIVSRPTIDISKDIESGYAAYVEQFIQWMKANPDYASYLNERELEYVQHDAIGDLYKQGYYKQQALQQNAK